MRGVEIRLMLVITRKTGEKIVIGDEIEISVLAVGENRIRFGIEAPKHIKIQTHLKSTSDLPCVEEPEEFEIRELKSTHSAT